jgi:C4-dicarboxylate transporter DctM subunit
MFAAISGSDAAGAAAVGRMTIDRLVESGYPRPYACALVAAGACTGILIPPSIAYIIIGLVLGISVSTLFLAAVIPGLLILVSILVTNIVMNRLNLWEGGGIMTMRRVAGEPVADGQVRLVRVPRARHHLLRHLLGPADADRGRRHAVVVTIIIGFILGTLKFSDFPGHAGQLGQGERCDPADHRLLHPAGRGAGDHRRAAGLRWCADLDEQQRIHAHPMMVLILVAAGCVMETTPNIVILAPILYPRRRRSR